MRELTKRDKILLAKVEGTLLRMYDVFRAPNFTDRYDDATKLKSLADQLSELNSRLEKQ
jgi:hypothetical protein